MDPLTSKRKKYGPAGRIHRFPRCDLAISPVTRIVRRAFSLGVAIAATGFVSFSPEPRDRSFVSCYAKPRFRRPVPTISTGPWDRGSLDFRPGGIPKPTAEVIANAASQLGLSPRRKSDTLISDWSFRLRSREGREKRFGKKVSSAE